MENKEYWIQWIKAAGMRAVRTVAETAVTLIGANQISIVDIDWPHILGLCATAGVLSLLVSLKGLPEIDVESE